MSEMTHVDDFIDDPKSDPYAASWFESFRRPALDKMRKPDARKLFATWKGARYTVTGCSRLGDVWLHSDLNYKGYVVREAGRRRRLLGLERRAVRPSPIIYTVWVRIRGTQKGRVHAAVTSRRHALRCFKAAEQCLDIDQIWLETYARIGRKRTNAARNK